MAEKMSRRRVKLYALNNDRQWDDRGTGHVTSAYVERLKGMSLLVRAELDGTPLLESKIQSDTAYQKQQGTLIVWSERDNYDLALSFQEKAGCDEIWEKICQVQGKDPSVEVTQDVVDESEEERFEDGNDSSLWIEQLPPCELGKIEAINEMFSGAVQNANRREKLALAIENDLYIKKLVELFRVCEDLENTEALQLLYEIFKNIFLLNKNSLLEVMFADENILDVIGALEFDPAFPSPKKHREFLKSTAIFKEVIPIENLDLLHKIHQTYRVQYIQDVALPNQAIFEENVPSTITSFIYFNKVEIVSMIQEDERFLSELFLQLSADEVSIDKRKDLIMFLKEFCTFSQTLQPPSRENFYKTLASFGVLRALEYTLAVEDQHIRAASVDILGFFVEFSPSMVRDYMMQRQHKVEEDQFLMNIMLEQMVLDIDPEMGGAVQLMGILRILIDPENMLAATNKAERADFLSFFYKHCMHFLIAPLLSNTIGDLVVREDYQTAQLIALVLELLSFCVEHHTYHIKNYIIHRDLLRKVLVLVKSKHTFLVLSAVRFLRKIIGMRDEFYNRHIVALNLFAPVVETYVKNNSRYNLLDSAILEIFEFIKTEDIKSLTLYVMEKFGDALSSIDYVQTFVSLKIRYNQYQDKIREREKSAAAVESLGGVVRSGPGMANNARFRRDVRDMDAEEELWFRSDDDCDEDYGSSLKQELLKDSSEDSLEDEEAPENSPLLSPEGNMLPVGGSLLSAGLLGKASEVEKEDSSPSSDMPLSTSGVSTNCSSLLENTRQFKQLATNSSVTIGGVTVTRAVVGTDTGVKAPKISLVAYDDNSDEEDMEEEHYFARTSSIKPGMSSVVDASDESAVDMDLTPPTSSCSVDVSSTTSTLSSENDSEATSPSKESSPVEDCPKVNGSNDQKDTEKEASVENDSSVPCSKVEEVKIEESKIEELSADKDDDSKTDVAKAEDAKSESSITVNHKDSETEDDKIPAVDDTATVEKANGSKVEPEQTSEVSNPEEISSSTSVISGDENTEEDANGCDSEDREAKTNGDEEKRKRTEMTNEDDKITTTTNGLEECESDRKKPRLEVN